MSRRRQATGSDLLPRDTARPDGPGGRIIFKKRWPADIVRQHPELKNRPFQRALGTSDAKAAWPLAAAALLAYQQHVEQYRVPSLEELRSAWLADLTASQRRKLVEAVNAELGGEQRTVFPPGTLLLPDG